MKRLATCTEFHMPCSLACSQQAARSAVLWCPQQLIVTRRYRSTRLLAVELDEQHPVQQLTQEQGQQVPLHVASRLDVLQREVQQAYEAGYQAGYTAGIQVHVNVDLELNSSRQHQQKQQDNAGNRSSSSDGQASAAAAPVAAQGHDSLLRSAAKGLIWRLFSTTATVGIALLVLHDILQVEDAVKLGALEFAAKFLLYFVHERIWAAMPFF